MGAQSKNPKEKLAVLVIFERVVMDDSEPTGLRVYAWAKLVKVWASLRWSDLQAIRPGELKLVEGRLATTLRRTKTSGPNRRIKEMPLCVSEAAFFENPDWLKVGFELLQWLATFSRDYLLPKLKPDFAVFEKKMAEYADVVAVSAAILQRTGMPAIVQGFWTEHSERSVLPTGLGVLGVSGPEKDLLGRWKPAGSDTYARSYGGRVAKLQLKFAVAARDENRYHVLDEREVASSLQDWLKDRHSLPEETAAEVAGKLADKWRTGKIQVDQAPPIVLESVPDMEVEGPDADSDSQEHPDPPAAKVPRAEDEGLSTWQSSSLGRYSDCTDRGQMGAGWGGGGSSGTVRSSQVLPINPNTPTFVACVGLAAERGRIQLGKPPQPCREMGRR